MQYLIDYISDYFKKLSTSYNRGSTSEMGTLHVLQKYCTVDIIKWTERNCTGCVICTVLAGFNEFSFNESSRFNESVLTSKLSLLHKKFEFNEYPGLTNNWLGPRRFVKADDRCICI